MQRCMRRLPGYPDWYVEQYMRREGFAHIWERWEREKRDSNVTCDAEMNSSGGIEEPFSAQQSSIPLSQHPKAKHRGCKRKSQNCRKNAKNAMMAEGGSRLVLNKLAPGGWGVNTHTCLLDSIYALMEPGRLREALYKAMVQAMPAEGDTTIAALDDALASHGLELRSCGKLYHKEGGAALHLMMERDCRLVISIKLTNTAGQKMSHFVAWDGKVVYDKPQNCWVNSTSNRADPKLVFGKLYPKNLFSGYQITKVFMLNLIDEKA